jgi:hypothetical protein
MLPENAPLNSNRIPDGTAALGAGYSVGGRKPMCKCTDLTHL